MQRKYNMALQHFYQAATNTNDDNEALKLRLKDLSGSEDELYISERYKQECFEMKEMDNESVEQNTDYNENNSFFKFKSDLQVKRVKPESICSKKGCILLFAWFLIFTTCLLGITYFIQLAINNMNPPDSSNFVINHRPVMFERFNETKMKIEANKLESCTDFKIKKVWQQQYDKIQTESPIRLFDVNSDGVDDILMGFVTSYDGSHKLGEGREICEKHYKGQYPCFGGVFLNNGVTGERIWTHFSSHEIYAINCNGDLDVDGVPDCLCAGRGGVFEAVSGRNGTLLWMFLDKQYLNENMNLYTPQFIYDIDFDGVMDVLQIHGGDPYAEPDSETRLAGKILFFSGKTGLVLKSFTVPDEHESYFSPVIYTVKNGSQIVVFGTGGETHGGSLFIIQFKYLYEGKFDHAVKVLTNDKKGFMNPPVLVDVNKDGIVDIINSGFSDSITAIDGETLDIIWTFTLPMTETYSIAAPGYYNNDDTVDFMVRMNNGPGFPVFYDSKLIFLDGRTGVQINNVYKTSTSSHSSPLSVSMEGSGNDLFLYWTSDCLGHEHEGGMFSYVNGTNVHESSRADSCIARFDTKSFSRFSVSNRKNGFPGKEIFNSETELKSDHEVQKRHIGIPDHGGVQRIIQTGSIATSLSTKDPRQVSNKFDVLFASYYIAAPRVRAIRPSDMKCIEAYRKKAEEGTVENTVDIKKNKELGFIDEADSAINNCLSQRMNLTTNSKKYDKYAGKLTLYRYEITCVCEKDQQCAKVLPKKEQGWTGYMGSLTNGYFLQRDERRFNL